MHPARYPSLMEYTHTVVSPDGTPLAYERIGEGPPVILVGGAFCTRDTHRELAGLLAPGFTVFNYDRRGRGGSGDTFPYAVDREIEDVAALIDAAGGTALLYGLSSGGALALRAAASGLPVTAVAVYEPPYALEAGGRAGNARYGERLAALLATERRSEAVELFLSTIGLPAPVIEEFRHAPTWPAMEALAHTLAYEHAVLGDARLPVERLASITVPVLARVWRSEPAVAARPGRRDRRSRTARPGAHATRPDARILRAGARPGTRRVLRQRPAPCALTTGYRIPMMTMRMTAFPLVIHRPPLRPRRRRGRRSGTATGRPWRPN